MRTLMAVVGLLAASAMPAAASSPLDLFEESGLRMELPGVGYPNGVGLFFGLTAAGDVNGDGLADLAVGHPGAFVGEPPSTVFIALGARDLRTPPGVVGVDRSWRITPEPGRQVKLAERVGDVNGDGFDDIAVTTQTGEDFAGAKEPRTVLVWGRATPRDVDLAAVGDAGLAIPNAAAFGGVGDLDGDGYDDLAVEMEAKPRLLFGAASGYGGAVTLEPGENDGRPTAVAAAGDVNGDGRGDVAVGIPEVYTPTVNGAKSLLHGAGAVVYGDNLRGATVDLGDLGSGGFRVRGEPSPSGFGRTAAGFGDVNADGFDDVAFQACCARGREATVILGSAAGGDVNVESLGNDGYRLTATSGSLFGELDVARAGDLNGDGRADVVVGTGSDELADVLRSSREAYVVFGGPTADLDLMRLEGPGDDPRGYRMLGVPGDRAGNEVAVPGDMDGDGQVELAVLAYRCTGPRPDDTADIGYVPQVYLPDEDARSQSRGRSTLGADTLSVSPEDANLRGRDGDDQLTGDDSANCLFGDYGDDVLSGAAAGDALIAGAGDDEASGGDGQDLLMGDSGSDELAGGAADDSLQGRGGPDALDGESGDDEVGGGFGRDVLRGSEGNDRVDGRRGNDILRGGDGDDFLDGGLGNDVIEDSGGEGDSVYGGPGDDKIDVADGNKDTVACDQGEDTVRIDERDVLNPRASKRCEHVIRV